MKPSLQLKIGQSLTMTPQLQQAIRLLQLSSLDLQNEIQEALESNPMLEGNEDLPQESKESDSNGKDTESSASEKEASEIDTSDALKNETIDKDLAVDTQWEDWQYSPPSSMARSDDDREFEYQGETSLSLHDHLAWQLDFTQISERDKTIALVLIDEIDDEGYLRTPISDIEVMLNEDEQEEFDEPVF